MIWSQIVEGFQKPLAPLGIDIRERTHKQCLGCQKLLPLNNFYSKGADGRLVSRCKPCYKAQQKLFNRRVK